jgi:hypothetical protein
VKESFGTKQKNSDLNVFVFGLDAGFSAACKDDSDNLEQRKKTKDKKVQRKNAERLERKQRTRCTFPEPPDAPAPCRRISRYE